VLIIYNKDGIVSVIVTKKQINKIYIPKLLIDGRIFVLMVDFNGNSKQSRF